jgi:hypothetical protein
VQVAEIGEELARSSDERGFKCQDQSQTERIHEAKPLGIAGIDIKDNDSPTRAGEDLASSCQGIELSRTGNSVCSEVTAAKRSRKRYGKGRRKNLQHKH